MAANDIYLFLRGWINQVLNTELSLGIKIIQSHQNAPSPEKVNPYIAIKYAPSRTKIGTANPGDINASGIRKLVNDYVLAVELWEVNGDGDLLELIIDSIERQEIKDLWRASNYSFYQEGQIVPIPRLKESDWVRECLVELTIGRATATSENSGFISEVEIEGTVPAQGRPGNHTV